MERICFVTCRRWPGISESDALAQRALERRGREVAGLAWNDPRADFEPFDALVLRSNWDYHHAPGQFLDWLADRESAGARIWNPPALVRWNLGKDYLIELAARGIPAVPTVIVDDPARLPDLMAARGWATAVLKPLVSASAHDTRLVPLAAAPAAAAALARGEIRQPAIAQPFVEEIRTAGEWSLVFIDGAFTHAVLKRPAPDDFRVQSSLGGRAEAARPPAGIVAAGQRALAALPLPPLYARIDGVQTRGAFVVMEVEVNEPGLFFTQAPEAAERFAEALLSRLDPR